jgi:hypothetical protein
MARTTGVQRDRHLMQDCQGHGSSFAIQVAQIVIAEGEQLMNLNKPHEPHDKEEPLTVKKFVKCPGLQTQRNHGRAIGRA